MSASADSFLPCWLTKSASAAFRWYSIWVLGKFFTRVVSIQAGQTVVEKGAYRFIRHPSYLGLLISSLGWALAFRSLVGVALTALLIPPLIARIRAEEALLAEAFGDEYAAYRARARRLVPGLY